MQRPFRHGTFSCFSPPVMIATFAIEIVLALYALFFRKLSKTVVLGILLLVFLAIFQLAEFGICEEFGPRGSTWSKIAFSSITLLPPIGVHLAYSIAKKTSKVIVPASYLLAAVWIGMFLFGDLFSGQLCGGNYVVFNLDASYDGLYFTYYNFLILLGMGLSLKFANETKVKKVRKALRTFVVGYLAFVVPSIVVRIISNPAIGDDTALPSIMCGFAVLLALIFSFGVLPLVSKKK